MDKKVKLALVCEDAKEYQLMARGLFLVLDLLGEGVPVASPQHQAMLEMFKETWDSLPMEQRLRLINRMAMAMQAGAALEAAGPDLDAVAASELAQHQKLTDTGRRN